MNKVMEMEKMQVKVNLVGKDGNIFNLKSVFRKSAIRQGYSEDEVNALFDEMEKCENYHQAVGLLLQNTSSDEDEGEDGDEYDEYDDDYDDCCGYGYYYDED